MKQIVILAGSEVRTRLEDASVPEPGPKQVLIKVVVSGSNPKDWKMPEQAVGYDGPENGSLFARSKAGANQGDDIAGIVEKVGADVIEFKARQNQSRIEVNELIWK